jgi:NADPH:quinone reductase-like Zn-dependent oxidoreductase
MKAIAIKTFGAPEGLELIEVPDPAPGAGQVLITTEAIGVGGVDALIRSGVLGDYGFKAGHILGSEVAGTVTAVGADVDPAWVGRRVWAFVGLQGGYAERAVVPATALVPLPPELSAVDAVSLGSSGAVAHFALRHAHFTAGESVLIRGAAGGIGTLAVQLAAHGEPARWRSRPRARSGASACARSARRTCSTAPEPRTTRPRASTSSSTSSPVPTCPRSSASSTRTVAWWRSG